MKLPEGAPGERLRPHENEYGFLYALQRPTSEKDVRKESKG